MLQENLREMAQAQSLGSTYFSKEDIVEAITDNARKNFNKVIGLFCGGSEPSLMHELSSVTRIPKETLTELYIRIEGIVHS